jgi:hypothetical protein
MGNAISKFAVSSNACSASISELCLFIEWLDLVSIDELQYIICKHISEQSLFNFSTNLVGGVSF